MAVLVKKYTLKLCMDLTQTEPPFSGILYIYFIMRTNDQKLPLQMPKPNGDLNANRDFQGRKALNFEARRRQLQCFRPEFFEMAGTPH